VEDEDDLDEDEIKDKSCTYFSFDGNNELFQCGKEDFNQIQTSERKSAVLLIRYID